MNAVAGQESAPEKGNSRQSSRRAIHAIARVICSITVGAVLFGGCERRSRAAPEAIVRISQRNEPTDLDPATASLPDEFFIIRALAEGLLVPNPRGPEPLPGAAERYDVSDDGLTYTFHLRPEVRWSNGDLMTADDFVWSFRRALTPATAAPKAFLFHGVKNAREFATGTVADFAQVGIRAPDPRTVVVTLHHPNPQFPHYVASGAWIPQHPPTVSRHGRRWTQPGHHVGNGPFILAEWNPQQRIVVRRNPRYHGAAHVRLDGIHFIRFDSQDTEDRAFRAGQIDVTMAVPQSKLDTYARERPRELHRAPLAETRFITFNTKREPLNDWRVRRALALAIDRERLVTFVLRGGQSPAGRFLSPELLVGSAPSGSRDTPAGQAQATGQPLAATQRFDPVEARRLLHEAGYAAGSRFPRLELAGWVHNPVLDAIQQMWREELGIEISIVVQEAKVHLGALHAGNYDIAFVTNLLDVRDPVAALNDFTSAAPNNFPHWHSAEFDRTLESIAADRDPAHAAASLAAAEELLLDSAAVAPVYFNAQNWLMSSRVGGWQQDALWQRRYDDLHIVNDRP